MIEIGHLVKVSLPGERPWVTVERVLPDGRLLGRIDSRLIGSDPDLSREFSREMFGQDRPLPPLHDWKQGDLVIFERRKYASSYEVWEPSEGQSKNPEPPTKD